MRLNQYQKTIKVLEIRFLQDCLYQITLISSTNEISEMLGLQKNQKILTGIALVCPQISNQRNLSKLRFYDLNVMSSF
jgi:hypothetical protein